MFSMLPFRRETREALNAMTPRFDSAFRMVEDEFRNMYDRVFGEASVTTPQSGEMPRAWGLDVAETDTEAIIRAEAPGFEPHEFNVQLCENVLTIEARHEEEEQREGSRRFHQSRHFRRSLTVPSGLDLEHIDARYRNGILEIHIPRRPEAKARRIEVRQEECPTTPASTNS